MTLGPKDLEIADERTTQRKYRERLKAAEAQTRKREGPRNNAWTGTAAPAGRFDRDGTIVGRVALVAADPGLGTSEYYIGERYAQFDGTTVFNWESDIASTFFRGSVRHELCDDVALVRSFELESGEIVDFEDDEVRPEVRIVFAKRSNGLAIPAPPLRKRSKSGASLAARRGPVQGRSEVSAPSQTLSEVALNPSSPIRAERLLRERLTAPRKVGLSSVLATLQPDQYDLVARPAMESSVIQGPPGSGKTIIATHRAAYMINAPAENTLDGDVLVVGPTEGYAQHARSAIRELIGSDQRRVTVSSISEVLRRVVDVKSMPKGEISTCWQDADATLGWIVDMAIAGVGRKARQSLTPEKVYELVRANTLGRSPITTDPDWVSYLAKLPGWYRARTTRRHLPLLAYICWTTKSEPPVGLRRIEHVIVDEAQDVTGLEWLLLRKINQTSAWTIIGDLNQRRSDHTYSNWEQVLDVVEPFDCGPVDTVQQAYRSTKPILEFANSLLPKGERDVTSLRHDGPPPVVQRVDAKRVGHASLQQALRLLGDYPSGTVAVIATRGKEIIDSLRSAGWTKSPQSGRPIWLKGSQELTVLHHDHARGLEFDAVVVVEPALFPQNYGRFGPLYTALTRANRELAVVHSTPLPRELRR